MDEQKKLQSLARLQIEAKEKEGVVFAMYGALLAFSAAALLALMTVAPQKYLTAATCCALLLSCLSFGTIVMSRVHVLHKANQLHIGHIMVADDFSSYTHVLGFVSLSTGVALLVWHISFYCAVFFIAGLGFTFCQLVKFRKQFDALPDMKQFIDKVPPPPPADKRDP